MLVRLRALFAGLVGVAAIYGCDGPTTPTAQFDNVNVKLIVYAMNGTPVLLPSAVAVRFGRTAYVDATFAFDLAFDIDDTGAVVVYTQQRVASQLVATHRVGLQTSELGFAAADRAPTSGYAYDSLLTLPIGKTFFAEVLEQGCINTFLGPTVKAKFAVDSVNLTTRAIHLSALTNPNCGFKSLVPGEPKD